MHQPSFITLAILDAALILAAHAIVSTGYARPLDNRDTLPEENLKTEERNNRIHVLHAFSRSLDQESENAENRKAVQQLRVYIRYRISLLEIETRLARISVRYGSLIRSLATPEPGDPFRLISRAVVILRLMTNSRDAQSLEKRINRLVADINGMAKQIDRLLDQRDIDDKDRLILRPSSCLPQVPTTHKLESTPSNVQQKKVEDPELQEKWLNRASKLVKFGDACYYPNHLVPRIKELKDLSIRQRVAILLRYGYSMEVSAIAQIMTVTTGTVSSHINDAIKNIGDDPHMTSLLQTHFSMKRRSAS